MTQAIDYQKYEINERVFFVNGPAFVGTVSRTLCTIKRIFTYPDAHAKTPFAKVAYDNGYIGLMSLSELINIVDTIYQEQLVEESGPDGWHTLNLSTDENGRIDFSSVDEIANEDLEYQHQRTLAELASMDDELAGTGRM